jgi:hypothetical protein
VGPSDTLGAASSFIGEAEIEGPKFEKLPCTHRTGSALAHRTAGPTGKRMRRGAGVPARGPVEVNRGPLMTSGLLRLIGGCTVYRLGRPRIPHASALLTLGTASSFIEGRNRGAEILKAPPAPIAQALRSVPHTMAAELAADSGTPGGVCRPRPRPRSVSHYLFGFKYLQMMRRSSGMQQRRNKVLRLLWPWPLAET